MTGTGARSYRAVRRLADDDQTGAGGDPADAGAVIRVFVEGDMARLSSVLHPDVEVRLAAFVEPDLWLRGREAVLRWYKRTAGSHRAYLHRVQEAAPAVWLAFGRMQLSEPERGYARLPGGVDGRASQRPCVAGELHETEAQARAAVRSPRP